ncbi:Nif3-like dinuclear metal center hexameric protein [Candidatus Harpocratesius sp.]
MFFNQIETVLKKNFPFDWTFNNSHAHFVFGQKNSNKVYRTLGISLYPSKDILLSAKKRNIHLLITYFSPFLNPIQKISDSYILLVKIMTLADISVFVIGDLINYIEGGVLDLIIRNASLNRVKNIYLDGDTTAIPIGRKCTTLQEKTNLKIITQNLKKNFKVKNISLWGDPLTFVRNIGIFEPKSLEKLDIDLLSLEQIDLVISYDLPLNLIWRYFNIGVNVINLNSYYCLSNALQNFHKQLNLLLPRIKIEFLSPKFGNLVIE